MKVKITRKRDLQTFTGVKTLTVIKKGHLLHHVYADIEFGEGASTKYMCKEQVVSQEIPHNSGMGIDFCEKIEIIEEAEGVEPVSQ